MSGDIFEIDQGDKETISGTLHDRAATPGDVLTVQADGSVAAAPGGGGATAQAVYSGNAVSIGNGGNDFLTFDSLDSGTELLDRTTPSAPTFLAAGTYAFRGEFFCAAALTANGFCTATLSPGIISAAHMTTLHPEYVNGLELVTVVAQGDLLQLLVDNEDGVASRDFSLSGATLVKLA